MRFLSFSFSLILLLSSCNQENENSVTAQKKDSKKYIALVPFGYFDKKLTSFLQDEVEKYYNKKVLLILNRTLDEKYINLEKGKRYSTDSIIKSLSAQKADTIITYVGLTHDDIFTTKRDAQGKVLEPIYKYKVWGLFGLGYLPGNACIISDFRLKTNDLKKYQHRIRTVVLHEIGHNYGLPHCPDKLCIMSDANEKIATVDNSSTTMCTQCIKMIQ